MQPPLTQITDKEGLDRAYKAPDGTYTYGKTLYVAGTRSANDWLNNAWIPLGQTQRTPRYQAVERALAANPKIVRVTGHSLGAAVAMEEGKRHPELKTRAYDAPVVQPIFMGWGNGERYREFGDPVSIFDWGSHTSLPTSLNPHSYKRIAEQHYSEPTRHPDSWVDDQGVEHMLR